MTAPTARSRRTFLPWAAGKGEPASSSHPSSRYLSSPSGLRFADTTAKGAAVTDLVVGDVALYVAHTNADVAAQGVCAALAEACGLDASEALTWSEDQPLGRVGDLPEPEPLHVFVERLAGRLPATAGGVRVSGPPDAMVRRVAVLGGAGDDLFDAVRASAADVYVTADLRHHPALEARDSERQRRLG